MAHRLIVYVVLMEIGTVLYQMVTQIASKLLMQHAAVTLTYLSKKLRISTWLYIYGICHHAQP